MYILRRLSLPHKHWHSSCLFLTLAEWGLALSGVLLSLVVRWCFPAPSASGRRWLWRASGEQSTKSTTFCLTGSARTDTVAFHGISHHTDTPRYTSLTLKAVANCQYTVYMYAYIRRLLICCIYIEYMCVRVSVCLQDVSEKLIDWLIVC